MPHSQAAIAALLGGPPQCFKGATAADSSEQQYPAAASAVLQVPVLSCSNLNATLHATAAVSVSSTKQDDAMQCVQDYDQCVADGHTVPVAAATGEIAAAGAVGRGRKRVHQDSSNTALAAAAATDATYDSNSGDAMQLEPAAECNSSNSSTTTAAAAAAPLLRSSPRLRTSSTATAAQSTTTAAATAAVTAGVRTMSLCSTPQPERRRSSRLSTTTPASTTVTATTANTAANTAADTTDDMLVSPAPSARATATAAASGSDSTQRGFNSAVQRTMSAYMPAAATAKRGREQQSSSCTAAASSSATTTATSDDAMVCDLAAATATSVRPSGCFSSAAVSGKSNKGDCNANATVSAACRYNHTTMMLLLVNHCML
jgi:hypothetical protein